LIFFAARRNPVNPVDSPWWHFNVTSGSSVDIIESPHQFEFYI